MAAILEKLAEIAGKVKVTEDPAEFATHVEGSIHSPTVGVADARRIVKDGQMSRIVNGKIIQFESNGLRYQEFIGLSPDEDARLLGPTVMVTLGRRIRDFGLESTITVSSAIVDAIATWVSQGIQPAPLPESPTELTRAGRR